MIIVHYGKYFTRVLNWADFAHSATTNFNVLSETKTNQRTPSGLNPSKHATPLGPLWWVKTKEFPLVEEKQTLPQAS